jgi:peptide/nickel transport system ATP-binding protein
MLKGYLVNDEQSTCDAAAPPRDRPLILADNLVKRFKIRRGVYATALDGLSLSVSPGEAIAIVGESGSGKTTLIQCLAWLERPDSGRVYWHGEPIDELDPEDLRRYRRDIQVVFQGVTSQAFNPRFTVGQVIEEPLQIFPEAAVPSIPARVRALMLRVGLEPWMAARRPRDLSAGERQRVGIARALASGPQVLLCDEPTTGLDVVSQAPILSLLRDLRERDGLSIVFTTHNLALAPWVSDRCAIMHEGRIVEEVPSDRLLDAEHPRTRALIDALPIIP